VVCRSARVRVIGNGPLAAFVAEGRTRVEWFAIDEEVAERVLVSRSAASPPITGSGRLRLW